MLHTTKFIGLSLGLAGQLSLAAPQASEQARPATQASTVTAATPVAKRLIVLSSHDTQVRDEFIPAFTRYYTERYKEPIVVDWLDQGGSFRNLAFVRGQFVAQPKSSGIDIFWGGGEPIFDSLKQDNLLDKMRLSKELEVKIKPNQNFLHIIDKDQRWYATALSSFGIVYDKDKLASLSGKTTPALEIKTWEDLGRPELLGQIAVSDPRQSNISSRINQIIMQTAGWKTGWAILLPMIANAGLIGSNGSDALDAVAAGKAIAFPTIDFYGYGLLRSQAAKLAFATPYPLNAMDADPIGILKGAPNRLAAERFAEFVISREGQAILSLPLNAPNAPKTHEIGRIAINRDIFNTQGPAPLIPINPFTLDASHQLKNGKPLNVDRRMLDEIIGVMMIDARDDLQKAWGALQKKANKTKLAVSFLEPLLNEKNLAAAQKRWRDPKQHDAELRKWLKDAREHYKKIAESP